MAPLPDPDAAVALPVDRLALILLQRLEPSGTHGRDNIIGLEVQQYWPSYAFQGSPSPKVDQRRYRQAMSEAFDWLMVKGLIAQDATQNGPNWVTRTRKGERVAASGEGLRLLKVDELLAIELHPTLTAKAVREKFARGDVEDAVWAAVKQVEVSVFDAAGAEKGQHGMTLMAWAFKPGEGPLHDGELDPSEQAGMMALYQGLIGTFRNPGSHRDVDFEDPVEAAEIILFADLLLRMLARLQRSAEG